MGCHSTEHYADSHLADTATTAGAAADKAASNKVAKYRQIANSHIFVPVAIESALSPPSKRRCGLTCSVFNILPSGI